MEQGQEGEKVRGAAAGGVDPPAWGSLLKLSDDVTSCISHKQHPPKKLDRLGTYISQRASGEILLCSWTCV